MDGNIMYGNSGSAPNRPMANAAQNASFDRDKNAIASSGGEFSYFSVQFPLSVNPQTQLSSDQGMYEKGKYLMDCSTDDDLLGSRRLGSSSKQGDLAEIFQSSHTLQHANDTPSSEGHVRNFGTGAYMTGTSAPGTSFSDPLYKQSLLQKSCMNDFVHSWTPWCYCPPISAVPMVSPSPIVGSTRQERPGHMGPTSLLDQFRADQTQPNELSQIAGHCFLFSLDHRGSLFIQQHLQNATPQEREMVLKEIIPNALTLMANAFGNYVVQKLFDVSMPAQIRELAERISGHVLTLSLHINGCRVIQKAIEVVELDQKVKLIKELDGHVLHCIHDQSGNHVIQKCIDCVPEEHIQFIISPLRHQVVRLSTHSYGCRVIQKILGKCHNPNTQKMLRDEILGSVRLLAFHQYGNYVIQQVLQCGQPKERTSIIQTLAKHIVEMSKQKFASNVLEKCLAMGSHVDRQLIVDELLGSTEKNDRLHAVMAAHYGNYVVQKLLKTCNDEQRELILSRIKVHLNVLQNYAYEKDLVGRVQQLVAYGERYSAVSKSGQSSNRNKDDQESYVQVKRGMFKLPSANI